MQRDLSYLVSPNGDILQIYNTVLQPRYWHWYNQETEHSLTTGSFLLSFYSFPYCSPSHSPKALTTINLFSISIILSFLRIFCKWNHMVCDLLRLSFLFSFVLLSIILWNCHDYCGYHGSFLLLLLNSDPWTRWTVICLAISSTEGHLAWFPVWGCYRESRYKCLCTDLWGNIGFCTSR